MQNIRPIKITDTVNVYPQAMNRMNRDENKKSKRLKALRYTNYMIGRNV